MFSIVEFLDDHTCEYIPNEWVTSVACRTVAYWPKNSLVVKRKRSNRELPSPDLYDLFEIRVLGTAGEDLSYSFLTTNFLNIAFVFSN
jgi:hypothetical protein